MKYRHTVYPTPREEYHKLVFKFGIIQLETFGDEKIIVLFDYFFVGLRATWITRNVKRVGIFWGKYLEDGAG